MAKKLGNPRLKRITFHTLRHWKATMLYHQTKDILYVMQYLGHRNINNTLKYIQLENALFTHQDDEYICKVATTIDDAKALIERGFEYVCDIEHVKVFRKRK
jgi:integrase